MTDIATDLKQKFEWAMNLCLESYEVLADGRSFERSDRDEYAIEVFKQLHDSVDAIPPSLIQATEQLRAEAPEFFQRILEQKIQFIGPGFVPTNAAEFLGTLHQAMMAR